MIGATSTPPVEPISAARPKLNSVMRLRSMPISRAASGFSAQARSARPSVVFCNRSHRPRIIAADTPASHTPWVGTRKPPMTNGASPENGGSE